MTLIEEMTEPQRQSWITFLADGAILIWFWKAMAGGFNLTPSDFSPSQLSGIFIQLVVLTIILHAGISIAFEMRKRKEKYKKDERDLEIARQGSHAGYWVLQLGVGVIIVTLLIQYVVGDSYQGPISVIRPVEMVFGLCLVSYLADLYRHGTIIWAYRH